MAQYLPFEVRQCSHVGMYTDIALVTVRVRHFNFHRRDNKNDAYRKISVCEPLFSHLAITPSRAKVVALSSCDPRTPFFTPGA